ncbi:unnamed protein product, partial [Laminaria digitata]
MEVGGEDQSNDHGHGGATTGDARDAVGGAVSATTNDNEGGSRNSCAAGPPCMESVQSAEEAADAALTATATANTADIADTATTATADAADAADAALSSPSYAVVDEKEREEVEWGPTTNDE